MRAWGMALALFIALPAQAGDWLRARTPNFVVESDTSAPVLRRHAQQLEAFRTAALWVLGKDGGERTQRPPTQLMLLKQRESLNEVRPGTPRNAWGYMSQCEDGAVAFAAVPPETRSVAQDWGTFVVFHEYAHRLMFQVGQRYYPAWFVEGFADFMAGTEIEAGRVTFGQAVPWRTGMLADGGWLDAATLLAAGPEIYARHERTVGLFYAQAWLLTHFMLNDTALARRFYDYFEKVGAGADPVQAFEPAVGIAVPALNQRLRQHLATLQTTRVSGRDLLQADPVVEPVPGPDGQVLLAAAVLKTCPPRAQGEQMLARLRALDGEPASQGQGVKLARARAELAFGDPAAARDALLALVAQADDLAEAHQLLARALVAAAPKDDTEARDAARQEARTHAFRAYRLQRQDAPTLYRLAQILQADGVTTNLRNAARGAQALEPLVPSYAVLAAQVALDAGQRDEAIAALVPLATYPHNPPQVARLRRAIEALRQGAGRAEFDRLLDSKE